MDFISSLIELFLPWLTIIGFIFMGLILISWARKRRSGAIIFATLMHFFLPDPQVEKTIKIVQQQKSPQKKQQDGSDEPECPS